MREKDLQRISTVRISYVFTLVKRNPADIVLCLTIVKQKKIPEIHKVLGNTQHGRVLWSRSLTSVWCVCCNLCSKEHR